MAKTKTKNVGYEFKKWIDNASMWPFSSSSTSWLPARQQEILLFFCLTEWGTVSNIAWFGRTLSRKRLQNLDSFSMRKKHSQFVSDNNLLQKYISSCAFDLKKFIHANKCNWTHFLWFLSHHSHYSFHCFISFS